MLLFSPAPEPPEFQPGLNLGSKPPWTLLLQCTNLIRATTLTLVWGKWSLAFWEFPLKSDGFLEMNKCRP